jgi:hypothetical protein
VPQLLLNRTREDLASNLTENCIDLTPRIINASSVSGLPSFSTYRGKLIRPTGLHNRECCTVFPSLINFQFPTFSENFPISRRVNCHFPPQGPSYTVATTVICKLGCTMRNQIAPGGRGSKTLIRPLRGEGESKALGVQHRDCQG